MNAPPPTTALALIRHGPTAWNAAGRIQGRHDEPLDPAARADLAAARAPEALAGFGWVASPLARARETAALLAPAGAPVTPEPALIEADWGDWEGASLAELRARLGERFAAEERRGLDFTPPGGESPRMVQQRLTPWLARIAAEGRPIAAVTHKGVIRAVLGLATGWDFLGKPPARLDWRCAHLFALAPDGTPRLSQPNLPLLPAEATAS